MTFTKLPLLTEARKKSLHARICPKETYTQKEFVEHVAMFQHLPKNIIGAALDACIDELCDLLASSNIVELGELGFSALH